MIKMHRLSIGAFYYDLIPLSHFLQIEVLVFFYDLFRSFPLLVVSDPHDQEDQKQYQEDHRQRYLYQREIFR